MTQRMIIRLMNRAVLSMKGVDAGDFLQATTTNDINLLKSSAALYSLLLNHRGRIVHDIIIYQQDDYDQYLIECDMSHIDQLKRTFDMYKMHKKLVIEKSSRKVFFTSEPIGNSVEDPRVPAFGRRLICERTPDEASTDVAPYEDRRFDFGIAEGLNETAKELPVHMNADIMNGVSLTKGCYIGQELTTRSINLLDVKKRVLPFTSSGKLSGIIRDNDGKKVGKILASNERKGLAVINRIRNGAEGTFHTDNGLVRPLIPMWWPSTISSVYGVNK